MSKITSTGSHNYTIVWTKTKTPHTLTQWVSPLYQYLCARSKSQAPAAVYHCVDKNENTAHTDTMDSAVISVSVCTFQIPSTGCHNYTIVWTKTHTLTQWVSPLYQYLCARSKSQAPAAIIIPLCGRKRKHVLHTLLGTGSAAPATAVALPR